MFDNYIIALITVAVQLYIWKKIKLSWKNRKKNKDIKNGKI